MSRGSEGISFGMGILFGVAAGIAAGVILAPKSGEETRKQLKEAIDEYKENMPEELDTAKKAGIDALEKVKISVEGQIQKVNEHVKANKLAEAKKREEEETGYEL